MMNAMDTLDKKQTIVSSGEPFAVDNGNSNRGSSKRSVQDAFSPDASGSSQHSECNNICKRCKIDSPAFLEIHPVQDTDQSTYSETKNDQPIVCPGNDSTVDTCNKVSGIEESKKAATTTNVATATPAIDSTTSGRGRSLQDTMKLALENAHPRDAQITFEEGPHLYRIDGEAVSISVTGLIHDYFPAFEPDVIIDKMLKSKKFPNGQNHQKYRELPIWAIIDSTTRQKVFIDSYKTGAVLRSYETAKKEILSLWDRIRDEASSLGTKMHANCELYLNGVPIQDSTKEFQHFLKFYADLKAQGFDVYRTEQIIWDKSLDLAGSVDCQAARPSEKGQTPRSIRLLDWKRSREIKFNNPFQKGLGIMSNFDDCNFIHYSLQLNIYKRMLEEWYDVIVESMAILVFHPSNESYVEIPVNDMSHIVEQIFQERRLKVAGSKNTTSLN